MFKGNPGQLRKDWREDKSAVMRRRRQIVALSLIGAANLSAGTLVQTGLIKRLPDLACKRCSANRVSTSDAAYALGGPDAPLAAAGMMANAALAAFGPADRAEKMPLLPLGATVKAGADLLGALAYLRHMVVKEKSWCGYCLFSAVATAGILALTIPETLQALRRLRSRD